MSGTLVRVAAVLGGAAVLATGAVLYMRKRKQKQLGFAPSDIETGVTRAGDMTLTHYRDKRMPIQQRIGILQDLTWKSVQDPRNRKLALQLTRECPERDGVCETKAVYDGIKNHIRYTGDIAPLKMGKDGPVEGVDLFQAAHRTWEFGGGDCDDHSVLAATLLTLNGIPAKFRVTAPRRDAEFSHIYVLAGVPKLRPTKWIAVDTTLPGYNFAKEAPYGRNADYTA